MCIPGNMEVIKTATRQGPWIIINNQHVLTFHRISFQVAEDLGITTFENHGANTVWGASWSMLQAEFKTKFDINLPDSVSPCPKCDGSRCRDCDRHS